MASVNGIEVMGNSDIVNLNPFNYLVSANQHP